MNTNAHTRSILAAARAAWENRSDPESIRPLARVFWYAILVCVSAGVVSIVVGAGLLFFGTMNAITPADTLPVKRNQRLDRAKLDEVVTQIEARHSAFEERRLPVTIPPDPSI